MGDSDRNYSVVPTIDLREFPGQSGMLIKACEEWGCFRIVNFDHVMSRSLMLEMKGVVNSLFELPTEVKQRNVNVIAGSGYMAPSQINPLYEALGLYDMSCPKDVHHFCSNFNLDPTSHQRAVILKYAKAVNELMMDIGRKIGEGLGLGLNRAVSFEDWACQFRINKYTFTPETLGSQGVQLHTDSSFLTVLQDDEVIGGLEVMKRCGTFQQVHPSPGTLLVNLGDIATVWSNGRFLNVKHRVMCREEGIRYSIASFLLGPKEAMVEAPEDLVDSEHPRLYVPFTYKDYRSLRVSNKFQTGETVDSLRIQS